MLRTIPATTITSAIDGVLIRASALGIAQRAHSIEAYARARAAGITEASRVEAQARERAATAEGYAAGYSRAWAELCGFVHDIDRIRARLLEDVLAHARTLLADHCRAVGFNAEWIEHWCRLHAGADATPVTIFIPETMPDLLARLQALDLDGVAVRASEVQCVTLVRGEIIHEFLPDAAIFDTDAMRSILGADHVVRAIRARADLFADAASKTL
jgi:hypothetical protein